MYIMCVGASPFLMDGVVAEWLVRLIELWMAKRWQVSLEIVPGSQLLSNSYSSSLIVGIYPAASARRHVLMSPTYEMISTPV